ncbi:MAG: hypothetical protein JNM69_36980 [Archangium sp.]|nr:hypothetical protein [Archangium sp.]
MRTLPLLLVVVLSACGGAWLPDVPPPAPRQSAAAPFEIVFKPSKAQPAALWSSTLEHTAWVADGQLHWLSASGRGALPIPATPLWDADAVDGQGWALTSQRALVQLTAAGALPVPAPPMPLEHGSRVHAFERDVLIVATPFEDETQPASLCVFRATQWSCARHTSSATSLFPDGRDPGSPNAFLFHEFDGVTRADFSFELTTGLITRLTTASAARALESGTTLQRDGRAPLQVTWSVTQVRVGCFDPDGKVLPVCTREGPVTEVIFSELEGETVREVAHAHLDANVSTLRRHGSFLVSFTLNDGVVITLP